MLFLFISKKGGGSFFIYVIIDVSNNGYVKIDTIDYVNNSTIGVVAASCFGFEIFFLNSSTSGERNICYNRIIGQSLILLKH